MIIINVLQYEEHTEELEDVVASYAIAGDLELDEALKAIRKEQEGISTSEGYTLRWEDAPGVTYGYQRWDTDHEILVVALTWGEAATLPV